MKIYTKTGDTGETSLFDGTRVSKTHPRVAAYGEVDELQASIGMARAAGLPDDLDTLCVTMQRDLFAVGAQLADPRHREHRISQSLVETVEPDRLRQKERPDEEKDERVGERAIAAKTRAKVTPKVASRVTKVAAKVGKGAAKADARSN